MWTIVFVILLIAVFGKLLGFALKAAWGILRFVFGLVFLPLILIGLVLCGLIYFALPALVIIGIVVLAVTATKKATA